MKVIGFKPEEIQTVYKILAAILHLVSRAVSSQATVHPPKQNPPSRDYVVYLDLRRNLFRSHVAYASRKLLCLWFSPSFYNLMQD